MCLICLGVFKTFFLQRDIVKFTLLYLRTQYCSFEISTKLEEFINFLKTNINIYFQTPDEEVIPSRKRNNMGTACTKEMFNQVSKIDSENWTEILPMTELRPGYPETRHNYFKIDSAQPWTHLRLNMYPDGGIARLRVYGEAKKDLQQESEIIDLVSMKNGGVCKGYSNAHYGHPRNLIRPGDGINMGDGWETARRLDRPAVLQADNSGILRVPGSEWAVFRLGDVGRVAHVEVDTKHFKGNFPDSVRIEGALLRSSEEWDSPNVGVKWSTLLPTSKVSFNFLEVDRIGGIRMYQVILYFE